MTALDDRPVLNGALLRIATAGSVDDGKSTLIGRLLFDSKQIFEDTIEQIAEASDARGTDLDLSLITDGLRAEREQGITIDVAYRHFATPRRSFILADTPGHIRYTRNMVTGASTADLALVLVDARNGFVQQSRRHLFIASLLRIPHVIVCINKMDLVDYDESVFDAICAEVRGFASRLEIADLSFVPISALEGDNVVEPSSNMLWHGGPPLLYTLEHVQVTSDRNLIDVRLPVQWVIRPGPGEKGEHVDYRGYAGKMASGVLRVGDEVKILPSGETSTVKSIENFQTTMQEATLRCRCRSSSRTTSTSPVGTSSAARATTRRCRVTSTRSSAGWPRSPAGPAAATWSSTPRARCAESSPRSCTGSTSTRCTTTTRRRPST
jgi:bifunctional enzyme CysN/CysC